MIPTEPNPARPTPTPGNQTQNPGPKRTPIQPFLSRLPFPPNRNQPNPTQPNVMSSPQPEPNPTTTAHKRILSNQPTCAKPKSGPIESDPTRPNPKCCLDNWCMCRTYPKTERKRARRESARANRHPVAHTSSWALWDTDACICMCVPTRCVVGLRLWRALRRALGNVSGGGELMCFFVPDTSFFFALLRPHRHVLDDWHASICICIESFQRYHVFGRFHAVL